MFTVQVVVRKGSSTSISSLLITLGLINRSKKYPIIGYRYCFFEKFIFLELLELANKTSLFFV